MTSHSRAKPNPVVARLAALGVDAGEVQRRLRAPSARCEVHSARTVLQREDEAMRRPRYLLSGWAARFSELEDGRRQVFDLVLPGEGLGVCLSPRPFALTNAVALTRVELVDASDFVRPGEAVADGAVRLGLEKAADLDERRLLEQVVRLGRMSALERLAHLFLDLYDRLALVGLVDDGRFDFPVTQELLADLLGLSTVHVNRTIQELRRQQLIVLDRSSVTIASRRDLSLLVGMSRDGPRRRPTTQA